MASPDKTQPKTAAAADLTAGDLFTLAQEYESDRKRLRWAIVIAAVLHLVIFLIKLPEMVQAQIAKAEKPKVYVVTQVRFRPPQAQQQEQKVTVRSRKVPIPDPTPDEPEPIRVVQEVDQPDLDIPADDTVYGIPEGPPPAVGGDAPIMVGGEVKAPEKITAPQPQYTEIARKARIQGVVIVQAIIDRDGNVTNVKVLKGLPMGLEESAVDAIKQWKFKPATLNGRPVTVYYNLTVNFKLQ